MFGTLSLTCFVSNRFEGFKVGIEFVCSDFDFHQRHLGISRLRCGFTNFLVMAALEFAMKEKEERLAQERSMKQACRFRLIADKGISVASIQSVLSDYLRYKKTNDLWCLVAPPATGPQTFGWHTYPSADWLCKTASLLYDLVGLAPNTKLQSTKLVKCLRAMYDHKELHVDIKKGTTLDDSFDKLDLTIRVLLNMIRTLKCNEFQRLKVQRSLTRQDWSKLEFVLDRVQLPAELMAASSQDEIEEEDVSRLRAVSVLNELPAASDSAGADVSSSALVPFPVKSQQKQMGAAHGSLKPLPSVFQKHFAASEMSHEEKPVPVECSKFTSGSSKKTKLMEKILQEASIYKADASNLPLPKSKAKKTEKKSNLGKKKKNQKNKKTKKIVQKDPEPKTKKEELKKKKKTKQAKTEKEECENRNESESALDENTVYKPGTMAKKKEIYVKSLMENSEMTRLEAAKSWQSSLSRAMLLQHLSISELVKRRFVAAGCKSNPFAELVAQHTKSQDVD